MSSRLANIIRSCDRRWYSTKNHICSALYVFFLFYALLVQRSRRKIFSFVYVYANWFSLTIAVLHIRGNYSYKGVSDREGKMYEFKLNLGLINIHFGAKVIIIQDSVFFSRFWKLYNVQKMGFPQQIIDWSEKLEEFVWLTRNYEQTSYVTRHITEAILYCT